MKDGSANLTPCEMRNDKLEKMRKRHLEIVLSQLRPHPKPKLRWEAYTLDAGSAAEIAYIAGQANDDVKEKSVIDLGCGIGILAISASLLGAEFVVGVDIDKDAVRVAEENAESTGAEVEFAVGDLGCVVGGFDTTLMNPPFGSWRRGADVEFLRKALDVSDVVYSLHKRGEGTRDFLRRKIQHFGGKVDGIYGMRISISRTFDFHRKEDYSVEADLYRILRVKS